MIGNTNNYIGYNVPILITYSELVILCNNQKLQKGATYRITDYECTTTQENTRSAGHIFDIIVVADDEKTLNENARAVRHEGDSYFKDSDLEAWEIKYSLYNDKSRFAWADEEKGKGVVYYLKDEHGNECPYDFKNIQFKRFVRQTYSAEESGITDIIDIEGEQGWKVVYYPSNIDEDSKAKLKERIYNLFSYNEEYFIPYVRDSYHPFDLYFTRENEQKTYLRFEFLNSANRWCRASLVGNSTSDYRWFYTFSAKNGSDFVDIIADDHPLDDASVGKHTAHNNVIEQYDANPSCLNNIVFISGDGYDCYNNIFAKGCYDMTLGEYCYNNSFGNGCYSNSFGNDCQFNSFGNDCYSNLFGTSCYSNSFGNDCYSNSFGNDCYSNNLGNSCYSNFFGGTCYYNSLGNDCSCNSFSNDCYSNSFGNGCYFNSFDNECQSNSFGNSCDFDTVICGTNYIEVPNDADNEEIGENNAMGKEIVDGNSLILIRDNDRVSLKFGKISDNNYLSKVELTKITDEDNKAYGKVHAVTRDEDGKKIAELVLGEGAEPYDSYLITYDEDENVSAKIALLGRSYEQAIRASIKGNTRFYVNDNGVLVGNKFFANNGDAIRGLSYNISSCITEVEYAYGVNSISNVYQICAVTIPITVTSITGVYFSNNTFIYYKGTKADWEKIEKATPNGNPTIKVFCIDGETTYQQ
ncbi:MAG: hypothetical protein ACI4M6_05495 [Christensenellaceae bacterium]